MYIGIPSYSKLGAQSAPESASSHSERNQKRNGTHNFLAENYGNSVRPTHFSRCQSAHIRNIHQNIQHGYQG